MLAEFAKKNLHLSLNALAANAYGLQCGELEWGGTGLLLRPRGRRARPDRGQQRRDLPLGAIQAGEQSLPVPLTVGFQGPEGRRRRSSGQVRSHGFTSWARGARIVSQRRGRLCAVAHTTAPVRAQRSPRCISRRCNRGEEWTSP